MPINRSELLMPIRWKRKFKPDLVLRKISEKRTVSANGGVSFSGFEVQEHLPILASMLDFPAVAERLNQNSLIWSALVHAKGELNGESFADAINSALEKELAVKESRYVLATSLSIKSDGVPQSIKVLDAIVEFMPHGLPKIFGQRDEILKSHRIDIPDTPENYLPVRISVRDKSPTAAAQSAIDGLDLLRGLIALYANYEMQWTIAGSPSYEPINRVRCGSRHTIHTPNGRVATEAVWFEPNFRPAKIYDFGGKAARAFAWIRRDLREISASPYRRELTNALIQYARAFDEPDQNAAFVRLWAALESLTTPNIADYDKLVRRCSFLYANGDYHQQVLEHLREYRNRSVHSGISGDDARTNCFLLQTYFRGTLHFYKRNRRAFKTLADANDFLDLPPDKEALAARVKVLKKAIKFVTPIERKASNPKTRG